MTISPYSNAGTGATASVLGTDRCGVFTLTTGTGSSNGIQFQAKFSGDGTYTAACNFHIEPLGSAPAPTQVDSNGGGQVVDRHANGNIFVQFNPVDNTTYQFAYSSN